MQKNSVVKIIPLRNEDKLFKHSAIGIILNERFNKNWVVYSRMHIYKIPMQRTFIADINHFSDVITCYYTHKKRPANIAYYIPNKTKKRAINAGYQYIMHLVEESPEHLYELEKYTGQELPQKVKELLTLNGVIKPWLKRKFGK